jgi:tetratricopeptide (TPR) repeat protein
MTRAPLFTFRRASLALALCAAFAAAQSPAATAHADLDAATASFRAGNAAYEGGDFSAAAEDYARAETLGARDARLYFNHGNALFRAGRLGPAILYYEKARKLDPADEDILHNLNFARARGVDKVTEPPANALTQLAWRAHSSYAPGTGAWIALGLFAAGFCALTAALFARGAARVAAWAAAALAFAALLLLTPSLAYKLTRHARAVHAVALQPVVPVHSGPGDAYELLFRAHEGAVFSIVSREGPRGEWLAVKLPDGRGGFVKAAAVGEVR